MLKWLKLLPFCSSVCILTNTNGKKNVYGKSENCFYLYFFSELLLFVEMEQGHRSWHSGDAQHVFLSEMHTCTYKTWLHTHSYTYMLARTHTHSPHHYILKTLFSFCVFLFVCLFVLFSQNMPLATWAQKTISIVHDMLIHFCSFFFSNLVLRCMADGTS